MVYDSNQRNKNSKKEERLMSSSFSPRDSRPRDSRKDPILKDFPTDPAAPPSPRSTEQGPPSYDHSARPVYAPTGSDVIRTLYEYADEFGKGKNGPGPKSPSTQKRSSPTRQEKKPKKAKRPKGPIFPFGTKRRK